MRTPVLVGQAREVGAPARHAGRADRRDERAHGQRILTPDGVPAPMAREWRTEEVGPEEVTGSNP